MPILHTTQTGKGPIVVMLHGFLSSSIYFRRFAKRFEREYTIVTVDLLGSGHSARPHQPVTYDMQCEALAETLEAYEGPFILLGHSMGAVLAARYARKFPEKVSQLFLFNPPLFMNPEQAKEKIEATGLHYRAVLTHPRSRLLWKGMKALPRAPKRIAPPLNLGDGLRTHHHAREGGYQNIILRAEFIHDLTGLTQPTLLVVGARDRYVYIETLHQIKLPSTIKTKLVHTGHHTIVRNAALAEVLVRSHLLQ